MIHVAIVEDESHYQEQLIDFLRRYEEDRGNEKFKIVTFSDGDGLVENYQAQFDIILMDIKMSFMDGMSAAEAIRKVDSKVVIIFITNMPQYAIKGYAVDALDYILKPISYFQFSERLKRAIDRMKKRETHFITIKVPDGVKRVEVSDIFYVESQGHSLIFRMRNEQLKTTGTLKDLEEELAYFYFFRGHRGYLFNLEHIEGLKGSFVIVNGEKLPVGRTRRRALMNALSNYWGETLK